MYVQPEAHVSWLGSTSLDADGEIEPVIARYLGPSAYNGFLGFPYTDNTSDIRDLVHTTEENNITFVNGHMTKGLLLSEDTYLRYEEIPPIPETFSFTFKLKMVPESSEGVNLVTLIGQKDNGDVNYVQVYIAEGKVHARFSDHKNLSVECRYASIFDFLTIGVNQTATERALYFFADYGNLSASDIVEATPTGTFTKYYINRKLGEPL